MTDILFFIVLFPLTILSFLAIGIVGAIVFEWVGNKVFDWIADGQEWQQKKGWW
jgi:hypothetical protein